MVHQLLFVNEGGRLRSPSLFAILLSVNHRNASDHNFSYWPLDLYWATVCLDSALVLAINQFSFEEHVISGLYFGRIIGYGAVVSNAVVPLRLLLPLLLRVSVSLRSGDGELRYAPAVLRGTAAGIFPCEACQDYAIDIHKKFVPFRKIGLGDSLTANTPARPARSGVARVKPRGFAHPWSGAERTKRSGGLHKRSTEAWGDGLTRARAEPLVIKRCGVITTGVGIESVDLKNLGNTATAVSALDVNDEIDQIADLTLNGLIGEINVRAQRESG